MKRWLDREREKRIHDDRHRRATYKFHPTIRDVENKERKRRKDHSADRKLSSLSFSFLLVCTTYYECLA